MWLTCFEDHHDSARLETRRRIGLLKEFVQVSMIPVTSSTWYRIRRFQFIESTPRALPVRYCYVSAHFMFASCTATTITTSARNISTFYTADPPMSNPASPSSSESSCGGASAIETTAKPPEDGDTKPILVIFKYGVHILLFLLMWT